MCATAAIILEGHKSGQKKIELENVINTKILKQVIEEKNL